MKPFVWPLFCASIALALSQTTGHSPSPAAPNLDAIVRQSLQRELMNAGALDNYIYEAKESTITYDSSNRPSKTESKVTEYLWIDGSRYKRLIEENGQTLTGTAAVREQRKLDDELKRRRQESPSDKQKRLADDARRRQESRQTRDEVAKAFNFRLLGEETIAGEKCWKISAQPKPGYEGPTRISRFFPKMHGTIWVHQQGYEWLRVEAETLDVITFGGFLAKLDKGATFRLEQMRISDELWALKQLTTRVTARALLMRFNQGQQLDFRNYRKFSADSRMLEPGAATR
jgi:hypothetical protein